MNKKLSLLLVVLFGITLIVNAQCVQCDGGESQLGTNASRLGTGTIASGNSSFASGYNSTASGNFTTAIGHNATASGLYAVAIGKNTHSQNTSFTFGRDITATGSNSIVIGIGKDYTSSTMLTNNISNSIMIGVKSTLPSVIIRQQSTQDVPALVGIGTNNPKHLLHINGNTMISGSNKALLFATSESSTYGNFGIRYTGSGLNFYMPNEGSPTNYLLFIKNNGNIGIGKSNPTYKLDVSGSLQSTSLQTESLSVTSDINFRSLAGSSTKILTINNDGNLSSTDYATVQDNMGNHTAIQNINLNGNKLVGGTSGNGGIFVADNGNVRIGVGTMNPTKALEVNGTIRSKEVIVEIANWSDFVFDNNYKLMSLKETERFIKQNGHLPNVPSAAEVEKEGIELGEMNAILLQKIEELTLYVIELEKQIDELKGDK